MAVLLYLYVLILQMYGGGWRGLIFVLISAHALFCLATAATCTSPSKLPTLFSPGSVNGLLTQVLVCNYCWTSLVPRPSNPASVTWIQVLMQQIRMPGKYIKCIYNYYCTSGRAVQKNIRFEAGSIGPTVGRPNTEAENRIFSCTAWPKECDNIFIIWPSTSFFNQRAWQ